MLSPRVRLHLRLAGSAGALALLVRALGPSAPADDVTSLARALADAVGPGAAVAPEDVRWEPSEGAIADFVFGRRALFLGATAAGAPRDLYRARVRLSPEGHPLSVGDLHDLTQTPLGDDHALVVRGERAAFATFAYGEEQSVSVLDLRKEPRDPSFTLADTVMAGVNNVQDTGSFDGVGRVDLTLDPPARAVGIALKDDGKVAIEFAEAASASGGAGAVRRASYDPARAEMSGQVTGLRAEATRHLPKRFVFWAVDTVRAVPWIGPAPIAWLEDKTFAVRDTFNQLAFKLHGSDDTNQLASPSASPPANAKTPGATQLSSALLDGSRASADEASFPPPDIASIWKTAEPGEGKWTVPKIPWMKKLPGTPPGADAPPPFVRTFVRPDPERPYAQVLLVAMDMRQLELRMEAGSEDPKPLTGGHGPGRIPRDPAISTRVVAAFNGAFKTEHGNYGMMVNKRVLLPPQPGAASVVVLKDGRVGFGTWGQTHDVTGIHGVADADILSFRQNLDPLVDNGEINPTKRAIWGFTLPGNGTQTERSGVCATRAGHVVYAWGEDASATTLGRAMNMAGCVYGVHLDMNPHHTGFLFTAIEDLKAKKFRAEPLTSEMEISPDRYIEYAAKDFFYVLFHDPVPPPVEGGAWAMSAGTQPAPTWAPGLWESRVATPQGLVDVFDVEPDRATFRVRAGAHEPISTAESAGVAELAPDEAQRVLFTVGLGSAIEHHPRGLVTAGRLVMPVRGASDAAVLVVSNDGHLTIKRPEEMPSMPGAGEDWAEVLMLLDGGAVVKASRARPPAGGPRAALGTTDDGRVVVARSASGNEAALADALRRAGCNRAVVLDRGNHAEPVLDRTGTPSPPRAHYEQSVLYGVARPLRPRAFRFDAEPAATGNAGAAPAAPSPYARFGGH